MLVLTRKVNEKIRIGSDICITIVRVQGRSVRIGIEAPADVPILRAELQPRHVSLQGEENEADEDAPAAEPPVRTGLHHHVQHRKESPAAAGPSRRGVAGHRPRCCWPQPKASFSPPVAFCTSSATGQ